MIGVIAKANGYYANVYRKTGDKFNIASQDDFSEKWMKKNPEAVKAERAKAAAKAKAEVTEAK